MAQPERIILVGLSGSGKSTLARQISRRIGWDAVDVDSMIVESAGMPIDEIFEFQGEAAFRRLEHQMLTRALERRGVIIATGGGARSPIWRQMQADILGAPVWRTAAEEGPAHGAALLGGVVAGGFRGVTEAVEASVQMLDPLDPHTDRSARYDDYLAVYRDLYGSLRQAGHRLTELAESL